MEIVRCWIGIWLCCLSGLLCNDERVGREDEGEGERERRGIRWKWALVGARMDCFAMLAMM